MKSLNRVSSLFFFFVGALYLCLTPPTQVPDELGHFYRAFQISEGQFLGIRQAGQEGGFIPTSLVSELDRFDVENDRELKTSLQSWISRMSESLPLTDEVLSKREYRSFAPMVLYSPFAYFPQALGIATGRTMRLTGLETFYLARFFCLIFATLAIFSCMTLLSFSTSFSGSFFLIIGMPTCMFELASVSADVVTDCFAFLAVCAAFRLHNNWSKKVFKILLVATVGLSLCKTLYLFIPLVAVAPIFLSKDSSRREKLIQTFLLLLCCGLPCLCWSYFSKNSYVPVRGNIPEQIRFLMGHPLHFFSALLHTMGSDSLWIGHGFVGILGHMDTPTPILFSLFYLGVLFGCSLLMPKPKLDRYMSRPSLGVIVMTFFLIALSEYLYWNYVGDTKIEGMQGRYFIPLAPLLFFSLPRIRFARFDRIVERNYLPWIAFSWLVAQGTGLWTLLMRYWVASGFH
jgi:uncharacterized membrane protein